MNVPVLHGGWHLEQKAMIWILPSCIGQVASEPIRGSCSDEISSIIYIHVDGYIRSILIQRIPADETAIASINKAVVRRARRIHGSSGRGSIRQHGNEKAAKSESEIDETEGYEV